MPEKEYVEQQYVICYDIADDTRRERTARTLLDFGHRIQESVFVANLDGELMGRMKERLERVIDEGADTIHIFCLCMGCAGRTERMGLSGPTGDPEVYIV